MYIEFPVFILTICLVVSGILTLALLVTVAIGMWIEHWERKNCGDYWDEEECDCMCHGE